MSSMLCYEFSKDDITSTLNTGKELTVNVLVSEGLLTEAQADLWLASHAIIVVDKEPTLGIRIQKLFGFDTEPTRNAGTMSYQMVKIFGVSRGETKDNTQS